MGNENNHPKEDKADKKTNDDSNVHEDVIGENTEQTPLAKAVKGESEEDKQSPSEELG